MFDLNRRVWLMSLLSAGLPLSAGAAVARPQFSPLPMRFPRDFGSHPDTRTEWWYITGQLLANDRLFGFQVTFFRARVEAAQVLQSRFAAKQLLFAHAAVTDVQGQRLLHDQRVAREGFGLAQASTADTRLTLRDWTLVREGTEDQAPYETQVKSERFSLHLTLQPTQPLLLQGRHGWSQKGPEPVQGSHYYSQPQLHASGTLMLESRRMAVKGQAWLDHEWSDAPLPPQAVGWDWIGINLLDGGSLTAFRLRTASGSTLWDGGSYRPAGGEPYIFQAGEVEFRPVRRWKSPRSKGVYPVEWLVRTPADIYTVRALVEDQELDSLLSTGTIYWEGLSELIDSQGHPVGRGYLEMTGYAQALRL